MNVSGHKLGQGQLMGKNNEVYTYVNTIGEGSFGMVVKVKREGKSGQYYAIKTVGKVDDVDDEEYEALQMTSNITNVVKAFELIKTKHHNHILMELLEGGDLYNYIDVNGPMPRYTAIALFKKLVKTVGELLSVGLYPGDLKTENLYYSKEKKCLIILDLGGMKHINKKHGIDKKVATTSLSPPEYHLEKRRDKKERHNVGDPHLSWTLGTILWDMVTGQRISFENLEDLVNFKLQIPKSIIGLENSVTHQLLKKLLEVNPAKRLKFSLLHQYLQC